MSETDITSPPACSSCGHALSEHGWPGACRVTGMHAHGANRTLTETPCGCVNLRCVEGFNPGLDFPPDGATVRTSAGVATFRDGTLPGWHLPDGRYARPFDSLGLLLAQRWAEDPQQDGALTHPGALIRIWPVSA